MPLTDPSRAVFILPWEARQEPRNCLQISRLLPTERRRDGGWHPAGTGWHPLSLSREPVCARGHGARRCPGPPAPIWASCLPPQARVSARGRLSGTAVPRRGARCRAGYLGSGSAGPARSRCQPAGNTGHAVRALAAGRLPVCTDLGLAGPSCGLNPTIQPQLALSWLRRSPSLGDLYPGGACVVVFFSLFLRIQFSGKGS